MVTKRKAEDEANNEAKRPQMTSREEMAAASTSRPQGKY